MQSPSVLLKLASFSHNTEIFSDTSSQSFGLIGQAYTVQVQNSCRNTQSKLIPELSYLFSMCLNLHVLLSTTA